MAEHEEGVESILNISKTFSTRHQRAQISHVYSGMFPRRLEIPDGALYDVNELGAFSIKAVCPTFIKVVS